MRLYGFDFVGVGMGEGGFGDFAGEDEIGARCVGLFGAFGGVDDLRCKRDIVCLAHLHAACADRPKATFKIDFGPSCAPDFTERAAVRMSTSMATRATETRSRSFTMKSAI